MLKPTQTSPTQESWTVLREGKMQTRPLPAACFAWVLDGGATWWSLISRLSEAVSLFHSTIVSVISAQGGCGVNNGERVCHRWRAGNHHPSVNANLCSTQTLSGLDFLTVASCTCPQWLRVSLSFIHTLYQNPFMSEFASVSRWWWWWWWCISLSSLFSSIRFFSCFFKNWCCIRIR